MEELIKKIVGQTGLTQEKAQEVLQVVMGHLKEILPAPLAERLEDVLKGQVPGLDAGGLLGGVMNALGGILPGGADDKKDGQ